MTATPRTIAVVAPHPDDEAIFSGGTIVGLVAAGHRVVVVAATNGDAGTVTPRHPTTAGPPPAGSARQLAMMRARELEAAAGILGVDAVEHLGFGDSGLGGQSPSTDAFTTIAVERAADRLAAVLAHHGVTDVICDPAGGIYPHPDHRHAHDVTVLAAAAAGIANVHAVTVDREHLHFVETHLVANAHDALAESAPGAPVGFGASTVEIDLVVTLDDVTISAKRRAMAAHASQMPADSAVMTLGDTSFASVYGMEWFCRISGPAGSGAIDAMVAAGPLTTR
jgi:LmbE family N-acetylglucosaminyl deacetylase